jgi:hypothetical protein
MEDCKTSSLTPSVRSWRMPREKKSASLVYLLVGTLCLLWWTLPALKGDSVPVSIPTITPAAKPFSWENISPSKSLEYHYCGDGFQCTRLEVPMDYNRTDTTRGRTFALAVVRIPAIVPIDDPRYGGAMLINPGKTHIAHLEKRVANVVVRWPRRSWNSTSILIRSEFTDHRRLRE